MPNWTRLVIDLPATIVDIWIRVYIVLMAVASLLTVGVVFTVLVLWFGFGVRWGW